MLARTPPTWIMLGGFALTLGAGCINAIGFLGVHHQALTHVTGTVSILSIELAQASYTAAGHALLVIGGFFVGAFLAGFIIRQSTLRMGQSYGVALGIESALLFGATYFLRHGSLAGDYLASMACGLQNAIATSYSGAVIRTTHLTGIVTDLGIACGHRLRGEPVDWFRFQLYAVLLLGFLAGGVLGAISYRFFGYDTLLFPAALTGFAAVGYRLFRQLDRQRNTS